MRRNSKEMKKSQKNAEYVKHNHLLKKKKKNKKKNIYLKELQKETGRIFQP